MKLDKTQKIEECASKDPTREVLASPYLDTERGVLVATDGRKITVLPVEVEEGDTTGHVNTTAIKAARKLAKGVKNTHLSIACNGGLKTADGTNHARYDGGKYPDWRQVVPDVPNDADTIELVVDVALLADVAKSLGTTSLRIAFRRDGDKEQTTAYGVTSPLYIHAATRPIWPGAESKTDKDPFAVVMPMKRNGYR